MSQALNLSAWSCTSLLAILLAGCSGQRLPAWVDFDGRRVWPTSSFEPAIPPRGDVWADFGGHRVWVEHSGIWPLNRLGDSFPPWAATFLDVHLERYRYYYEGPPVVFHVWCDVKRNGERLSMPVTSVPLRPRKPSGQHVVAYGEAGFADGLRVNPVELTTELRMWFTMTDWSTGWKVPFDKRCMTYFEMLSEPQRLTPGETIVIREFAYYTEDHPAYEEAKQSGNPVSITYTVDPGVGKTTVQVKVRVTPYDPGVPSQLLRTTRRDGTVDTAPLLSAETCSTSIVRFFLSDDLSEPGTTVLPREPKGVQKPSSAPGGALGKDPL